MKHLRQLCAVVVLAMALSFSASAGEILMPGATQTPQTQRSTTMSVTTETCIAEPDAILTPDAALDPVIEAALRLLQSLLSLF
jgi:hypothetical protein